MKKYFLILTFLTIKVTLVFSQAGVIKDPQIKEQYKKVIAKANSLFDEEQYTASIHFYKKAQKIAPEKKLAKFRLEDIITIFIKKEMAGNRTDAKKLIDKIEARSIEIENSMEIENADTLALLLTKINTTIPNNSSVDNRPEEWKRMEQDVRNEMISDNKKPVFIEEKVIEEKEPIKIEKPIKIIEETKSELVIPKDTIEKLKKELPSIKSVAKKEVKPKKKAYAKLVEEKKQRDNELMQKYPDGKTVEVIKTKTKTTTRTIIRKENKVTVYLKVKHNWGGEYYFIDNSPIKIQSITKYLYETYINYD